MKLYSTLACAILSLHLSSCELKATPSASDLSLGEASEDLRQERSKFSNKIDSIFSEFNSMDVPGCAVGVTQNGQFVHAKGYGSANLEHRIPIGRQTVFRTASLSKQFTALAVAILASRGEIDLDADIHSYLPDLSVYSGTVTVRQMVHHISGMGDYDESFKNSKGMPFRLGKDYLSVDEFYSEVAARPLDFSPGEKFQYSNYSYFLLSQVVERVTGETLRDFSDSEIFRPLGMEQTFFNDNVGGIIRNRADGYQKRADGEYEKFLSNLNWVGDGSVYTTLDDFLIWIRALLSKQVPGGPAVNEQILVPHPITISTIQSEMGSDEIGYGYGLFIGNEDGRTTISHTGSWVGFRSYMVAFPEQDLSAFMFCNRTDSSKGGRKRALRDAVLEEFWK